MKKVCGSNCKDPENRSKKPCVCGGHSTKAKKPKKAKHGAPNIKHDRPIP